ncbi:hypothetical protein BpHYR1_010746 [Brachionus plicatilis]|uniref:Uncharacterized protein n=1 Tax=Brachionus plicatilis TaxID=10195 RepID=A0A3M7PBW0_BRAPC|nr:hypothetical protein BpHYR1_010746 [Brachionus plicatilis]
MPKLSGCTENISVSPIYKTCFGQSKKALAFFNFAESYQNSQCQATIKDLILSNFKNLIWLY